MGLDMYLSKKTYVRNWSHNDKSQEWGISVKRGGEKYEAIQPKRITYIVEEVMYWRKFNALHKWFVDRCQGGEDDCRDAWVDSAVLDELLVILKRIDENHSLADELLPVAEGFFFGSTRYDEWYYEDIKNTIKFLEKEIAEEEGSGDYYYHSSW